MHDWSRRTKVRAAFSIIAVCLTMSTIWWAWPQTPATQKFSYTEFLNLVKGGQIKKVDIQYDTMRGNLPDGKPFEVNVNTNYVKPAEDLAKYNVELTFSGYEAKTDWRKQVAVWGGAAIIGVWAYFFFMGIGPMGEISLKFWESRNRRFTKKRQRVTFADVAGIDEAKAEVQEIVNFFKDPEEFQRLGGRIPRGVLLVGPSGTGKTLLARATANEANVAFYEMGGSEFVEMYVGVGARRIRRISETAKSKGRAIIYIDEIDAIGAKRTAPSSGGDREYSQTLNQLLIEMDGFEKNQEVIYMASTNRPEMLDEALTRSGRFDRRILVPLPDARGREQILLVHIRKQSVPLGSDVDLTDIARGAHGFSGADCENMVNEAALCARRDVPRRNEVLQRDFVFAKDKVMMGPEWKSRTRSEEDMQISENHEAGHALVAALVNGADQIEKVTTAMRSTSGGGMYTLPKDGRVFHTKEYLLAQLAVLMGGRVAEEEFLRTFSTGAQNDLERANDIAWDMVCSWGMSKLGPISVDSNTGSKPNPSNPWTHALSEAKRARIDAAIEEFVKNAEAAARQILKDHKNIHEKIVKMLREKKTIDGKDIYGLAGSLRGSVKLE